MKKNIIAFKFLARRQFNSCRYCVKQLGNSNNSTLTRHKIMGNIIIMFGNRGGAVVTALAFHRRHIWLSVLLVLVLAPRVFSPGSLVSSLHKNQHFLIPISREQ